MEQTTPTPPNGLPIIDEDIENVSASTSHYLRHHPIYFTIPLIAAVALEILIFLSKPSDPRIYLAPFFLPFIGYGIARSKIQHEFMQQFAAANGFSYALKGSLAGLDGSLFQVGDSRAVADVVSGQFQNEAISLFTYTYVTGYGRSRQALIIRSMNCSLISHFPICWLKTRTILTVNALFNKISGSGKELIKLEGDFDKYFSLNIQKGYEVEALEIFTPDVMAELINKAKALSLEIVNGHLFIYDNGIVGTKQGLYDLYGLAQYFIEKLGPVLARMKPSVVAMEQQAAEENL